MNRERERALQHIRAHERKAYEARRPEKRQQHLESARYLRAKYDFPSLVIIKAIPPEAPTGELFGRNNEQLNRAAAVQGAWQKSVEEFKKR